MASNTALGVHSKKHRVAIVGSGNWGTTIANGRDYLASAWWIATIPGLVLAVFVVCVGVLGDELRDRSDPNLSTR